jgi:D-sedoheptulose 7-phosphate isomerase
MRHDHPALGALYPELSNERDRTTSTEALLDAVLHKQQAHQQACQRFFERHSETLVQAARAMADVYRERGKMLAMGNGGSSCDAGHFAVEFLHPVTTGRPALPALNLAMDSAMLSAVGNDVGMEHVFSRQVEAHGRRGDGLIGFSTSGNSNNLLRAFAKARQMGISTFGLTGGDGGQMSQSGVVDHCLVVATDSIHRVQEVHVLVYHLLWDLVHTLLADSRGQTRPGERKP